MNINSAKAAVRKYNQINKSADTRLWIKDVSGARSQGYDYQLVKQQARVVEFEAYGQIETMTIWEDAEVLATSHDVYDASMKNKLGTFGAYYPAFENIESILNA